ncbi:phytanoyl-CoA dioxygenase family protein [Temperatibacter marinus]|uniref:Phytanoyl-CoA dioxygenase family protein n=1 Tax=Temperatibacter marinus TaxID=1456591 RepID=A0AA52EGM3_9PROT|nr:phytanoyl-CoA dioxygenase family protein [Temperatibacter marinus]WND02164.1 phytanoyl-CoA dioxygenase family protein [Temperatibacter marinus]
MKACLNKQSYLRNGYLHLKGFLDSSEIKQVLPLLITHHSNWCDDNRIFYEDKAINSYNLTGFDYLTEKEKDRLFSFICQEKVTAMVQELLGYEAYFLGTQLFFDPYDEKQNNYWHRDIQYGELSLQDQKSILGAYNPLHFRFAMRDERGIELVPGSHTRWDTPEEMKVRLEQEGHLSHEPLKTGQVIELKRGDLLIFSAFMIHRGLYGDDRLSLDLLYSDWSPDVSNFLQNNCLPKKANLTKFEAPDMLINSYSLQEQK